MFGYNSGYRMRIRDGYGQGRSSCARDYGQSYRPVRKPEAYVPPPPVDKLASTIPAGINFEKYDKIPVEVTGQRKVDPISSFDDADLDDQCRRNIKRMGYKKPTPVQKYAIPIILAGRDIMACAETGSGKTAAFLIPIIAKMLEDGLDDLKDDELPLCVVMSPTRELALQICNEASKFSNKTGLKYAALYGGAPVTSQAASCRGAHLIVATPGRLIHFIRDHKVSMKNVEYLVLDEADEMLNLGFEGDIRKIVEQSEMTPKKPEGARQTTMFSATFPNTVQVLARDFLHEHLFLTVGTVGGANGDVTQVVLKVDSSQFEKRKKLCELVPADTTERTLVFVKTRDNAYQLAEYLYENKYSAGDIHGNLFQIEREDILDKFRKGEIPVLVATSVAARGLDIDKVAHVINYDLPTDIDDYVHRIGRTGRCGNKGRATSFYCVPGDDALARALVKTMADAQQVVPEWLEDRALRAIGTAGYGRYGEYSARDARFLRTGLSSLMEKLTL